VSILNVYFDKVSISCKTNAKCHTSNCVFTYAQSSCLQQTF